MHKLLSALVIIAGVFLVITASPAVASSTNRYYDWSSTLETKQSKVLGITASAQESSPSAQPSTPLSAYLRFDRYIFGGGLTPSSPFYFIKPLQENIQLTFTFDQKAKDELRVQIAGERLEEMQKLVTSNNTRAITSAANAYYQTMTALSDNVVSLKKQNTNVDELLNQLEEETAKHNVILEQVRIQVPDQAVGAIDTALGASWKGTDTVADLKDRPAVPPDVVSRLQSLKSQGLLTPEEVNKLVSVKSRVEAREEIGKYLNEGVVSESDFLRLNETAKSFYPDEFYQIHETLRFQELQKLEDQKPDDTTLNKIQDFAKTYQPGDQVPAELRKYWVPVTRLEEIQNTLRPDLIDAKLFKQNDQEFKKFNEVVERFKPRPEDIAFIKNFIQKNNADVSNLPPEYQRMYNLGQRYGAQCGAGFNWVPESQNPAGGYCSPNGSDLSSGMKYDDFAKGKACTGNLVNAKSGSGACSAYPADCIPPGWSKTDTCVATPVTTETNNKITCPSNAHFVSVSYDPNGGYCIPNYTQVGFDQSTGSSGSACPASYHRSYGGGPCVPDYNTNTSNYPSSLPPLTTTPGGSYYTNSGRCGPNSNWVPESINPQGGYCASNPGTNSGSISPSRESQEAACRSGGGTCVSWMNGACGCERSGTGNTTSPTQYGTTPPTGYGSCPSGQYWNGSTCMTSTYTPPPTNSTPQPTSPPISQPTSTTSNEPVLQPTPVTTESTTTTAPAPSP